MTHVRLLAARGLVAFRFATATATATATAALALSVSFMQACRSLPAAFVRADGEAKARYLAETRALAASCGADTAGTFLAEVRAGGTGASFQMEGAWQSSGAFEAQFLSPLGEAWAQFQLPQASASSSTSAQASFGPLLGADQKVRLLGFIDTLATIGPSTLRSLTCGFGLLPTEGPKVFTGPQGQVLVRGLLLVAGHAVDLESVRDGNPRGAFSISSRMSAGLWKKRGGELQWKGAWGSDGRAKPHFLSIDAEGERVDLTFLDFD